MNKILKQNPDEKPVVLALIPARSGSKRIPGKNIRLLSGIPLLAHSILHAKESKYITRTIVSTDDSKYAEIANKYGAETPFIRPAHLAGDSIADLDVFLHCLDWLDNNEGYVPSLCVHLRPTCPWRNVTDIDNMIKLLIDNPDFDSIRSISESDETPFKMWFWDNQTRQLSPVLKATSFEGFNQPRQLLPKTYIQNASIDVTRTNTIKQKKSMTGEKIMGYYIKNMWDIDTETQWKKANLYVTIRDFIAGNSNNDNLPEICFDIDNVIANPVPGNNYNEALPNADTINIINLLYKKGCRISIYTARGTKTGIDWKNVTKKQLSAWGVKYHSLKFDKPAADFYVDDKLISLDELKDALEDLGGLK